ncbi:MAG: tRNA glutamyl-Q(34) synthetase GluQRS, partial [Burkholderiales bacterium]|nr:tRNA glutamyl-Q(34) synthetase GluQRS [Burkholderiales bacterium]
GSWLDARAHGGRWLLRIEDIDTPRCVPGAEAAILGQLAACGLVADEPPWRQSERVPAYAAALQALRAAGRAYPCACARRDVEAHWAALGVHWPAEAETPYPGTCRGGLQGRPARAWRLRVDEAPASRLRWHDRRLGWRQQDVAQAVGDFVLRRADGLWAYQLAVVVDDAAQGITDVVRGEDLADNTPRQILLQRALGLPTPRYLHLPLVRGDDGLKLSKGNGARAIDTGRPLRELQAAGRTLGLPELAAAAPAQWLEAALPAWAGIIAGFNHRPLP